MPPGGLGKEAVVPAEAEARPNPALRAAIAQAAPAPILRLSFPPTDGDLSFDANDYVLVDFRAVIDQWETLVRRRLSM